ncbi:hypothetical protein [Haloactinopolyspora sp.]|uniref:hypothetical protein n=1 Tax=Haloactinopolyspora sp. TaxID=1966353 RepID=UPI0026299D5E|nr:hypothetical protein [Haloactinopolyspora sp.]
MSSESDRSADYDEGGDPACWLAGVCPECGRFVPTEPPTTCPRCGTEITGY